MQPQMMISLATGLAKTITIAQLPAFCTLILHNASLKLYTFNEGVILSQCFSNYLAYFKFLEINIREEVSIDFIFNESGFLMPILLDGKSTLYTPAGEVISETNGNSCSLIHLTAGNYRSTLQPGKHKLLLVNFRAEWFIGKSKHLSELASLTDNYISASQRYKTLPHCAMAGELFRKFEQAKYEIDLFHYSQNSAAYQFIENCIGSYTKQLADSNFDLSTIYKMKALEIAGYIDLNYAEDVLDNFGLLAGKFNISERTMLRYFKCTLRLSVCDYVIKVRMANAMSLLKSRNLPVKEIAIKVGYPDPNYFSSSFKKFHGLSPKEALKHL